MIVDNDVRPLKINYGKAVVIKEGDLYERIRVIYEELFRLGAGATIMKDGNEYEVDHIDGNYLFGCMCQDEILLYIKMKEKDDGS
jgi:hypothetical protein